MLRVMFWDEKIELLKPLFDHEFPTKPIVILSSMRAHFFKGEITVLITPRILLYSLFNVH